MNTKIRRTYLTALAVIVGGILLLSGGAGMTAYAAQSALPGDVLYPVKTTLEQTRINLAQGAASRAELNMVYADRRLEEIAGLIAGGRFQNISAATQDFDVFIKKALAEVDLVSQGDPERAALLNLRISETLSRYGRTLSSLLEGVPDPVRSEMRRAIDSSQLKSVPVTGTESEFTGTVEAISPGAWIIGGRTVFIHSQTEWKDAVRLGDVVKVHATLNGDGDLVAREIELAAGEGGSISGSDDPNGNANGNTNSSNANGNANRNENENINTNLNQNGNDNGNDDNGGNTNSGASDDSSVNTNDNSGNDNGGFDDHGGNSGSGGGGSGSGNGNGNGDDGGGNQNDNGNVYDDGY